MSIINHILFPLIISFLFAYLLNPFVCYLEEQKITRKWGILLTFFLFFIVLYGVGLKVTHDLLKEIQVLLHNIPLYAERIHFFWNSWQHNYQQSSIPFIFRLAIDENLARLQQLFMDRLENLAASLLSLAGQLFSLILVPLFTFYFLKDGPIFKRKAIMAVPKMYRIKVLMVMKDINETLGLYIKGAFFASILVGLLSFISFLLLGLQFSLMLGVFNGIANMIPYFGPFLGAIPVITVALLYSPLQAVKVLLVLLVLQQIENIIITPQVMGFSIGFHPVTIILLLLLGGSLWGFTGLLLAVPVAVIVRSICKYFPILNIPLR